MKLSIFLLLTTLAGILMGAAGQDSDAAPETTTEENNAPQNTTAGNDDTQPTAEDDESADTPAEYYKAADTTAEGTAGSTESKDEYLPLFQAARLVHLSLDLLEEVEEFVYKLKKNVPFLG
ncbi:uncharacterized protein LOC127539399 isoform X2 [Antechinus flavipes]|uniref:uncharacterized protein LOC127539399 isoform X2 n=1 Tax=Antechinus flavipes TaxID=38775 RepID=UPI0022354FEA|nr:uncharacterized protein LOC127539399 isoform X2 [Antechinus flavipes]